MTALVNTFLAILGLDLLIAVVLYIVGRRAGAGIRSTIGRARRDRGQR